MEQERPIDLTNEEILAREKLVADDLATRGVRKDPPVVDTFKRDSAT